MSTSTAPAETDAPDEPKKGGALVAAWKRARNAHPVQVLRWLRVGMLAMVCATAVVYLVLATTGAREITTARRVDSAIQDIDDARDAATAADRALQQAADTGQVQLTGTGADFANATARIGTLLTAAAQGNAAGAAGRSQFQFVQGQLTGCLLAAAAVHDNGDDVGAARAALTAAPLRDPETKRPVPGTGGLQASLEDLRDLQRSGLARQKDEGWLDPVQLWSLAVAPLLAMLGMNLVTARILARHFHRTTGPLLPLTGAVTCAVGLAAAALTAWDESRLAAEPAAGTPWAMTAALLALAVAGLLNHLAYRPRLAEYRFPRP
ncbi:hypothetical protein ACFRU3_14525 [Streptomyces sp. NPDC056910]|uniref:hypothetical protein n=1 Tax=Streptomyces sp. NPDC056910 TaxID=3345964 RepID=UPI00368D1D9C